MTIAELIAKIQSSDWSEGATIAQQLSDEIKKLSATTKSELADTKKQVETILAVTAAEGEDFGEKLKDAGKKIARLSDRNQTLEQENSTIATELSETKQNYLLAEVGSKSGVNTRVLKTLLSEEDKLLVDGDKVTVNGTAIEEWAKNSQSDYYPALFPKSKADVELPSGGSAGADLPEGGSKGEAKSSKNKPLALSFPKAAEQGQKNINYWG